MQPRAGKQMRYILLAATGIRIGEMMALNVEHIVDQHTTVCVRHSVWRNYIGAPKLNSVRDVDLASPAAALLGRFLKWRTSGPLFRTRSGKRELTRNALRRFHSLLKKLGMAERGFHAFRRFRISTLRADGLPGKDGVPEHLINYWTGHKDQTMNGKYDYSSRTLVGWRKGWAEKARCGFDVPNLNPEPGQNWSGNAVDGPNGPNLTNAQLGCI